MGRTRLAWHLQTAPSRTIAVIELPEMTSAEAAALLACDDPTAPPPSELVTAVAALRRAGMPLAQITTTIESITDIAGASRLGTLAGAHPHLLKCLDRKQLSLAHAKQLVAKPLEDQRAWAEKAVAHRWSVAQLRARMRGSQTPTPDADLAAAARTLQDVLGAPVRLEATPAGGYAFATQWSTVPELQGILEKLARAPTPEVAPVAGRTRELIIGLDSSLEADQLVSHLLTHQ